MTEKSRDPSIYDRLIAYAGEDYAAFHMPGHKRQSKTAHSFPADLPWDIDITEIDGFDDLHHARGILRDSMQLAASHYGVSRSWYSVNGSTAGILSAVFAVTRPRDTVLMGRNCHKSVYNAVLLRDLNPIYIYPEFDKATGIACEYDPENVRSILREHSEIKAVILTSPTYEGVVSDIASIAALTHESGIPLIVDEAHGAHLAINNTDRQKAEDEIFPLSAVSLGADLVIQSLHKTLPALTQTAILHAQGDLVNPGEVSRYMDIFQTSSPSYILMSSADACIRYLDSEQGKEDRKEYSRRLVCLRKQLSEYRHVRLVTLPNAEPSKLILTSDILSGRQLYDRLRETYHIQPEFCADTYVLLMTGMWDTGEMYERLLEAVADIDEDLDRTCSSGCCLTEPEMRSPKSSSSENLGQRPFPEDPIREYSFARPEQVYTPAQADKMETEPVTFEDCAGRVSAEYAYRYPPGIPILVPGERISTEALSFLISGMNEGFSIYGLKDINSVSIFVTTENGRQMERNSS